MKHNQFTIEIEGRDIHLWDGEKSELRCLENGWSDLKELNYHPQWKGFDFEFEQMVKEYYLLDYVKENFENFKIVEP